MDAREYDLLVRIFAGEASAEDETAFRAWLAEDPSRQQLVDQLRRIWSEAAPRVEASSRVDARWSRLARRIAGAQSRPVLPFSAPRRTRPFSAIPLLQAAAVAALLIAAGLVWRVGARSTIATSSSVREARTAKAQRLALRLPDGTRVVLAPASRLTYDASSYGRADRAVHLEGQAYFEVQHDSAHPFVVRTPGLVARDLGTRFTARAFAGEVTAVAVAEGRVGVARESDSALAVVVEPGQVGTLNLTGQLKVGRYDTPDAFFAWTEGRLVFHDTPLADAVRQLDRWYDVRFQVTDRALARRPLTASFGAETLTEVLDLLKLALDVEIRRTGDSVILSPRTTGNTP
jgi:ferric-dicitrate binding protein FerR (iron transport regulator)